MYAALEARPVLSSPFEFFPTPSCQGIKPTSPAAILAPAALEEACVAESMECRVNGSIGKVERSTASASQLLDDRVTVCGPCVNESEEQHIEMALQRFASHTSEWYASVWEVTRRGSGDQHRPTP